MNRIYIAIVILLLALLAGCVSTNVANNVTPPSFKSGGEAFVANRSGNKLSEEDRSVMVRAARYLEKATSEPGLKVRMSAPDFQLSNAYGKKIKLSECLVGGPVVLIFYRGAGAHSAI